MIYVKAFDLALPGVPPLTVSDSFWSLLLFFVFCDYVGAGKILIRSAGPRDYYPDQWVGLRQRWEKGYAMYMGMDSGTWMYRGHGQVIRKESARSGSWWCGRSLDYLFFFLLMFMPWCDCKDEKINLRGWNEKKKRKEKGIRWASLLLQFDIDRDIIGLLSIQHTTLGARLDK